MSSRYLTKDGFRLELMCWEKPAVHGTASKYRNQRGLTHLSFEVDDAAETEARLLELGGNALPEGRLAIVDLVNGYFAATDAKCWDAVADFYTDDAVVWWNPQRRAAGRAAIVGFTRAMLGSDEIVTYHYVASFTPRIDGDTAEAPVRVRAMHHGVGARAGRFWESLAIQDTHHVKTRDGWRCRGYEWKVIVGLGSMDLFDGLRPA
jgi:ketosteroid isomerase-like protein